MDLLKRLRDLKLTGITPDEKLDIIEYLFSDDVHDSSIDQDSKPDNEQIVPKSDTLPDDLISVSEAAEEFGYSNAQSVRYWYETYPEIVKPYKVNGRVMVSRADCRTYLDGPGKGPQKHPKRDYSGGDLRIISSRRTSAEPLIEFDTLAGAQSRVGISRQNLKALVDSGKIDFLDIEGSIIVSVNQIKALERGQRSFVDFSIFDTFAPLIVAYERLGFERRDVNSSDATVACRNGEIANRKIGRLRFVSVADLERWLIKNHRI